MKTLIGLIKRSPFLITVLACIALNLSSMIIVQGLYFLPVLINMLPTLAVYFVSAAYVEGKKRA